MEFKKESKLFFSIAAFLLALAIAIGAFGAHGLKSIVSSEMLKIYNTGVQYHFYNTLGLMVLSIIINFKNNIKKLIVSSWLIITGLSIFSFSLYFLVLLNIPFLGAITPIGGTLLIIAWVLVSYSVYKD